MDQGQLVGEGIAPLVVAEISANHLGSRSRFLELIEASAEAGADLVKFQTYTADTMTLNVDSGQFQVSPDHPLWGGRPLYALYQEAMTPWEWQGEGFELARKCGIDAFSSPFDRSAVDFLAQFDPPAYKIASLEVIDIDLISYAARQGRPVIISGGAATTAELAVALEAANRSGASQTIPMLCTSAYPARPADSRLSTIPAWAATFQTPVGLSDHSLGITTAIAAVALGACMVEKHVTLSRSDGGVDSAFSTEVGELVDLVQCVREAWTSVQGGVRTEPLPAEDESCRLRRSLHVATDVKVGDVITRDNVRSLRPAGGWAPAHLDSVLGLQFSRSVPMGTPFTLDLIAEAPGASRAAFTDD